MNNRHILVLVGILTILSMLVGACAPAPAAVTSPTAAPAVEPTKEAAAPATAERILTIAISGDIETVDSDFSHFQRSNEVNYNTQDQFFLYGQNDTPDGYAMYDPTQIKGSAIESWEIAPDGLTMAFKVRAGTKFHHTGNPVTADDFIYWFDRGIETKSGYLWNIKNANIEKWKKTGDLEFKLTFSKPSPFFFYLFRDQSQAPVDSVEMKKQAATDDPWSTKWKAKNEAATGEFFVESWSPGVEMILRANPDYWAGKAYFDKVVLKIIPASADRVLLLQQGSVDIARDLSPDELDLLRKVPDVKVLSVPTRNQYHMGLNNSMAPFDNKLVRQALSYVVPYETIVNDVFRGRALAAQSPVARKGNGFAEGLWPYKTDLEKAKQLLSEAGFADGFEFTLSIVSGDPVIEELAVVMQSSLKEVGVTMNIDKQTAAIFAEGMDKKEHQAWLRDLLWYVDDAAYTGFAFYTCDNVINWMAYCNPDVDKAIYEAAAIWKPEDQARKAELTKEMQRLIIDDAPTLMLAETNLELAVRDNIEGYVHLPDNLLWYYPLKRK
jgi:peptide/nickel transport system substrate-binding protein